MCGNFALLEIVQLRLNKASIYHTAYSLGDMSGSHLLFDNALANSNGMLYSIPTRILAQSSMQILQILTQYTDEI